MNILHATNKVGLLPYRFESGETQFLLHLPRPKNLAEAHLMKWGMARGTVRQRDASGQWLDIRDAAMLPSIALECIEPHDKAALHEAEEELGLRVADMQMERWCDHGLLTYDSETKGSYALHVFSVCVRSDVSLDALKGHAQDALDIGWFTIAQMHEVMAQERMKAGYVTMVEAVLAALA